MPLVGQFYMVVNQNEDFWYEEAVAGEKYACGYDGYFKQHLLDIREIGTSSVIPAIHFADCWWRHASNTQAIGSAGDA